MSTKRAVQGNMGKSIKKWMCYTNPFTDPEIWAGFEVSHSYPFCLISLCRGSQTGPSIAWGLRGGNYLFIDWVDRWLRWPFCVPAWANLSPGSSGHFGGFVSGCLSQHFHSHLTWWLLRPLSHLSMPSHSLYSSFPSSAHQRKASCQADICAVLYFKGYCETRPDKRHIHGLTSSLFLTNIFSCTAWPSLKTRLHLFLLFSPSSVSNITVD